MDVLAAAATIGLTSGPGSDALGTIEEQVVLETISALAEEHPGNDDIFAEAAARVLLARSAGVEHIDPGSVFAVRRSSLEIQLRYRSEMLDVFTDLAIDLAIQAPKAVSI